MYKYNRGWYFCPICKNPYWFGNSFPFDKCYDCLPIETKERIDKSDYFGKDLEHQNTISMENKIEFANKRLKGK
ncbi:unnamed protein product [marine sediment metagenome]|uniref:Uncharacterized protein n=1 Tax=marine sediment metagenome TaxID=412755 RepID=X1A109_9ZZZZ